jgi:hypothetical protein
VCAGPVDKVQTLHRSIVDACQTIRYYPGIIEQMRQSMMRRVEAFIESRGGHFEHLLQMYTFSCNLQIKVSGHMLIWTLSLFGV